MMYRAQFHAANPSDVFLPILLTTFTTTLVAIAAVCVVQKINMLQKSLILFFGGFLVFIVGLVLLFRSMPPEMISTYSSLVANMLIFTVICGFLLAGFRKKLNVYDTFIEGAKEGFTTAIKIVPYLVAILVSIGVFRASGAMDYLIDGIRYAVGFCGIDTAFVEGLPTIFMNPLSGNGARGLMIDAMKTYGADSFIGRLTCVAQGSTDTIFYIAAVYFGSVGIRNTRHTISCNLFADLCGGIAAIIITYVFFSAVS
jgi:spore maturation protein SpmB